MLIADAGSARRRRCAIRPFIYIYWPRYPAWRPTYQGDIYSISFPIPTIPLWGEKIPHSPISMPRRMNGVGRGWGRWLWLHVAHRVIFLDLFLATKELGQAGQVRSSQELIVTLTRKQWIAPPPSSFLAAGNQTRSVSLYYTATITTFPPLLRRRQRTLAGR